MISDEDLAKTLDPHDEKLHEINGETYVMHDRISGNPKLMPKSLWVKGWDKPTWPIIKKTTMFVLRNHFSSIQHSAKPHEDVAKIREDIKSWGILNHPPIVTEKDIEQKVQKKIDRHAYLANQFSAAHDVTFDEIRKMSFMQYRQTIGPKGRKRAVSSAIAVLKADMS